jgi:undecaprenyl-diphosphatase
MGIESSITVALGVHAGTALSVLVLYGREVWGVISGFFRGMVRRDGSARIAICLVLTSIPAALVGLAASDYVERAFSSPLFVGVGFLISGAVLWYADHMSAKANTARWGESVDEANISYKHAFVVGVAQACAVFPGVSRSGLTISSALALKFDRGFAASYSFIASLPVILGAVILWPLSNPEALSAVNLEVLLLSTAASFVAGLAAMVLLRRVVVRGKLRYFSYYLWTIGAITLLWQARGLLGL